MTAAGKPAPKDEPRSINLHAIVTEARAFIVPLAEIKRGGIATNAELDRFSDRTELVIGLDLKCVTADGPRDFAVILGPYVDPMELAGELDGCSSTIVSKIALDVGLDAQAAARTARETTRRERMKARRQTLDHAPQNVTCDFCNRSVSVIVDGVRLCKRHAEEAGERPHGKIA